MLEPMKYNICEALRTAPDTDCALNVQIFKLALKSRFIINVQYEPGHV